MNAADGEPPQPRSRARSPLGALAGIALGVVFALGVVRLLPRGAPLETKGPDAARVQALGGALLPEDSGALDEVLFHYVPGLEPIFEGPYRDFLGTLDRSVRLVAVVPKADDGASAARLGAFLARIEPGLVARTRVVEVEAPISPWSKDRALVLAPSVTAGRARLLVPIPPEPGWPERANDWRTPEAVAAAFPSRFEARELALAFDAGDFAVTGARVIVDVNLLARNRARGLTTPAALKEHLGSLFGREIVVLGEREGDVPRHHLSMYMTPAGDGVVLVGDPRLARTLVGEAYAPGEQSPDTGGALRADFSPETLARFDRAASELAAAGFRVARIPAVAFDDKTYFAYTNGVYETRSGRRIAWVPRFDVPRLDEAARAVYEGLGWEVRFVSARAAYPFHGTIGCLVNVLARADR